MEKIEKTAYQLIDGYKTLPIPIEEIVQQRGIKLLSYDFKDNVSGILLLENGEATIGYNRNESRVRSRFTIAHELGHFMLHKDNNDLFVDREFKVLFRSSSSEGTQRIEIEANNFAACILMPENLLREEIAMLEVVDEDAIKDLAKKFDVSTIAMSIRIANIKSI